MTVLRAGLIGTHISATRLPRALKIMCDMSGIDLAFELFDTALMDRFDFEACVAGLREQGWSGVTVTHPYKTQAFAYAGAGMVPEAASIGAANTLVFADALRGYNTDYTGFLAAFSRIKERGPVVMAGAGGVARALASALVSLGVEDLAIFDLDPARAEDLAFSIGPPARAIPINQFAPLVEQASGLINATPLGMAEYPGSAFEGCMLGSQIWAFDAVYTPIRTAFLTSAEAAGLDLVSGFDLFRHMAIGSFQAYTGIELPRDEVLQRLEEVRP